jgi:hypothetical protein
MPRNDLCSHRWFLRGRCNGPRESKSPYRATTARALCRRRCCGLRCRARAASTPRPFQGGCPRELRVPPRTEARVCVSIVCGRDRHVPCGARSHKTGLSVVVARGWRLRRCCGRVSANRFGEELPQVPVTLPKFEFTEDDIEAEASGPLPLTNRPAATILVECAKTDGSLESERHGIV